MRAAAVAIVLLGLWTGSAAGAIRCGDAPGDDGDLLVLRLLIEVGCDCNGSRSAYMTCARQRIDDAVTGGHLRPECFRDAKRCASRSRCGRPGRVTCCKTVRGEPRCKIRKSAAACTASSGTVGICSSCCEACTNSCFGATSTSTTTTLPAGTCGDTAPTCGGTCPAGQVCARDDDIELAQLACRCFPTGVTPCMQSGFPACGTGTCLGGEVCQAISVAGDVNVSGCFCVPPASTCGPFPGTCQGFGACPPGQICSSFVQGSSVQCGCITTTTALPTTTTSLPGNPCGGLDFPQCGGECAEGFACQAFVTTGGLMPIGFCNCVVVGSTCATPPGGGCSSGQCPAGQICTAFVVGGTVIDCGCGGLSAPP